MASVCARFATQCTSTGLKLLRPLGNPSILGNPCPRGIGKQRLFNTQFNTPVGFEHKYVDFVKLLTHINMLLDLEVVAFTVESSTD